MRPSIRKSGGYPISLMHRIIPIIMMGVSLSAIGASGQPRRISGTIKDLGRVTPIKMVVGMATLIELPGPVTGIRLGNPEAVQYFKPDRPENEVTLVLQHALAKPTNLIIRSGKKKYVFDIVPSQSVHQDTLEVIGSYGGASIDDDGAILMDSSQSNPNAKVAKGSGP